jgi:hypothetical protein
MVWRRFTLEIIITSVAFTRVLLFPRWVLPWMVRRGLFCVVKEHLVVLTTIVLVVLA